MAEKRKGSLVKAFAKAALKVVAGGVLLAALAYGAWFGVNYAGRGERLTPGEAQLAKSVFGDEINTSLMRKHFRTVADEKRLHTENSQAMVLPLFSHIDFFGPDMWSKDYSKDNAYKFGLFMHETTHCWQSQDLEFDFKAIGVYPYKLTPTSKFRDFGAEQQADIVEDYSKRWLYADAPKIKHTAQDTLLARVVEDRFPQAKKSRERAMAGKTGA